MTIRPIYSQNGELISYDAFAGKLHGRKMRKRFPLNLFKNAAEAKKAAEAWAGMKRHQIVSQKMFGAILDERMLSQFAEAIDILSPFNVSILDAAKYYRDNHMRSPAPRKRFVGPVE
jgi:hypothetical protein